MTEKQELKMTEEEKLESFFRIVEEHQIIENNYSALKKFGFCFGGSAIEITEEEIEQIKNGMVLAVDIGGEYSAFVRLKKMEE